MRSSAVDTLARAGRLALLVGALVALCTLGVWALAPNTVKSFDQWVVKRHVAGPTARLAALEDEEDDARAAALAAALVADLSGVARGDRLDPVRLGALEVLVRRLRAVGEHEAAIEACEEWARFDPNNLRARVLLGQLLVNQPDHSDQGLEVLAELFRLAPEVGLVAAPWVDALIRTGRYVEAAEAARISERQLRSNLWTVSWQDGRPKSSTRRARVTPLGDGDDFRLEFSLQGPVESLRIEYPVDAGLTLTDPRFVIHGNRKPTTIRLAETEFTYRNVDRAGDSFSQVDVGGTPYLQIPLPQTFRSREVSFTLLGRLSEQPTRAMQTLANHPKLPDVVAALEAAGASEALEAVQRARRGGLPNQKVQVYWRRKNDYDGRRSTTGTLGGSFAEGRLEFRTTLRVGGEKGAQASHLRFDFPDVVGVTYTVEALELTVAGRVHVLHLDDLEFELMRGVEREDDVFTVIGADPQMAFRIPEWEEPVEALSLRGWAR